MDSFFQYLNSLAIKVAHKILAIPTVWIQVAYSGLNVQELL